MNNLRKSKPQCWFVEESCYNFLAKIKASRVLLSLSLVLTRVSMTLYNSQKETPKFVNGTGFVQQRDARPEFLFFNRQGGCFMKEYANSFCYDDTAGRSIPVHIVDSGANLENPVC